TGSLPASVIADTQRTIRKDDGKSNQQRHGAVTLPKKQDNSMTCQQKYSRSNRQYTQMIRGDDLQRHSENARPDQHRNVPDQGSGARASPASHKPNQEEGRYKPVNGGTSGKIVQPDGIARKPKHGCMCCQL